MADPFEFIHNVYDAGVQKNDEKGFADKLKECTELFFKSVNEDYTDFGKEPVHFDGIEFLDGYFIFAMGTNSVVHFRVKECPGWLFGIWWDIPDDVKKQERITGECFAQYEETINKFKPTRSELCTKIGVTQEEDPYFDSYSASKMIAFIRDEPYLAFCRDYLYWDYNEEYHTREEAKAEFDEYSAWHDNKVRYTKENDDKVLSFVKEKILPCFADAEIYDDGEDTSPRYEVVAPIQKNRHIVDESGLYAWFDKEDENGRKLTEEFKTIVEKCEAVADQYGFAWWSPIDPIIYFCDEKEV